MLRKLYLNLNKPTFSPLVRQLASSTLNTTQPAAQHSLEQSHIEEAIKYEPTLAVISPQLWQKAHETFLNHGLQTTNFLQIVTGNPSVLKRSPQKIIETLENWRSCQFGEYFLHQLLTKYPELLNITDKRTLLTQIMYLKSFAGTNKNVWRLLMNCPGLMQQSQDTIEQKIAYLTNVMRIEVPEIVKSEALDRKLEDIRCRHVFLERLGLFKPRPLKADPNEPTKNHRLYQITDTSEKSFATKICHVTLAEFEAFKELYQRELEREARKKASEDNEDEDFSDDEQPHKKR